MRSKKALPPVYLFFAIVAMFLLHFFAPLAIVVVYPWLLLGCVPLLLGITLNLSADRAFKKYNTTVKPFKQSTTLITTGVFRITRHPMYLGMILILTGLAFFMGSVTPFFVIPVFAILIEKIFVKAEEKMLADTFCNNWVDYCSKVRKWI